MVTPTYSLDDSLTIKVRAAVPVLQVEQCSLPAQCLAGEVALATLSMRNAGTRPMGDLRVLCSHPAYISHLQSGTDLYAAGKQSDTLRLGNNIRHTTPHTVLPQGQVLAAGETTALHIAYRGDDTGMHEISWLFVYTEPVGAVHQGSSVYAAADAERTITTGRRSRTRVHITVQPHSGSSTFVGHSSADMDFHGDVRARHLSRHRQSAAGRRSRDRASVSRIGSMAHWTDPRKPQVSIIAPSEWRGLVLT